MSSRQVDYHSAQVSSILEYDKRPGKIRREEWVPFTLRKSLVRRHGKGLGACAQVPEVIV